MLTSVTRDYFIGEVFVGNRECRMSVQKILRFVKPRASFGKDFQKVDTSKPSEARIRFVPDPNIMVSQ